MKKNNLILILSPIALVGILLAAFAFGQASAETDSTSSPSVCFSDSFESNDSFAAAKPVTPGFYTPLYVCAGDNDYYQIDLVKGQQLVVDLTFAHAGGDVELRIYDADQATVIASGSSGTDNESVTFRASESGVYYILVLGWTTLVENSYEMRISQQCSDCISYQGQLQTAGANANGAYEFEFKLYDAEAGGTQIGDTATQTLAVTDGLFATKLYFGNPTARAGIYPQFLNIAVRPAGSAGAFTPLAPRTELTAAPIALTLVPGATISGTATALNLRSSGNDGLNIQSAQDDGIQIITTGDEGIYIQNAGETGVFVDNAGKAAFAGQNNSTVFPAGLFVNTNHSTLSSNHSGGVGVYARGKAGTSATNPDAADLILGANGAGGNVNRTSDDGRISSDPRYSGSDLEIASMDKAWVLLDDDANSSGSYFGIYNETSNISDRVFYVQDDGDVFAKSYNTIARSSTRDGEPIVQYGLTGMQQRIEDFGTASLIDGVGSVLFSAEFTQVANTSQPYQVFLTPRGDCPLYLADTNASGFTVQAIGGATCTIDYDYRVSAEAIDIVDTEEVVEDDGVSIATSERTASEEVTP